MQSQIRLTTDKPLVFTLSEANASLGLIRRWTIESQQEIDVLSAKKNGLEEASPISLQIDTKIREVLARWQKKVQQIGAIPKGLWTVDFDHGHGLFCWRFPETEISFQHEYDHGGSGRKPISEGLTQVGPLCELP